MATNQEYYENSQLWGNSQYISLKEIVDEYIDGLLPEDITYNTPKRNIIKLARNAIKLYSNSAVKELTALEMDLSSTLTVVLPIDYTDYYKIHWVTEEGEMYTMAQNPNLSIAKGILQDDEYFYLYDDDGNYITAKGSGPSVSDVVEYTSSFNVDRSRQFPNGGFKIDKDAGIIQFDSNAKEKTIVLEYVSDGVYNKDDSEVKINKLAAQTINDYIYFYLVKRNKDVPQSEKRRARVDWQISERKMKGLLNPVREEDILQVLKGSSRWVKQN